MSKQRIQILVLLAILLALCLFLFLSLRDNGADNGESSAEETIYILGGIPQLTVQQLDIENQADIFTITYDVQGTSITETTAHIDGLDTDTLNQTVLQSIASNLGSLSASRTIAGSDADLSCYGLDDPLVTAHITYTDSTATLLLGDEAPGNEGTYAMVGDTIYLVDTSTINYLFNGRLDMVNPIVTPGNSQTTAIETVTLSGGALTEPVTIEQIPEAGLTGYTSISGYRMTAPVSYNASADAVVNSLQTLYGLSANEVTALATDADLSDYGLDDPYFTAQITTVQPEDEEDAIPAFTLAFSAPDENSNVYVSSTISPYLFTVNETSVPAMALSIFDCMEKAVITPDISTLSEVEVVSGDTVFTFSLVTEAVASTAEEGIDESAAEETLSVTLGDNTAIDVENFERFYQTLTAARYDAELTEADAAETKTDPLLSITYRWTNGEEHTVTFTEGPVRRALVALDSGQVYTTPSTYVDRVIDDLDKVIRGETVTVYQ